MPSSLPTFLSRRARAWVPSTHPLNTPLANPTAASAQSDQIPFPILSGGEEYYNECVLPAARGCVLAWFEEVRAAENGVLVSNEIEKAAITKCENKGTTRAVGRESGYVNPVLTIPEFVLKEIAEAKAANAAMNKSWLPSESSGYGRDEKDGVS